MTKKNFLYWFAGFLEADGSIHLHKQKIGDYYVVNLRISLSQKDKRPLLKVQETLGMGNLRVQKLKKGGWIYHLKFGRVEEIKYLVGELIKVGFLGSKQRSLEKAHEFIKATKGRARLTTLNKKTYDSFIEKYGFRARDINFEE